MLRERHDASHETGGWGDFHLTLGTWFISQDTRLITRLGRGVHLPVLRRSEKCRRAHRVGAEPPRDPVHSVLRSALEAADALSERQVGEVEVSGERYPVFRFQGIPAPHKEVTGMIAAMACYAGQSVGDVRREQPAAEIIAELVEGAEILLRQSGARTVGT